MKVLWSHHESIFGDIRIKLIKLYYSYACIMKKEWEIMASELLPR